MIIRAIFKGANSLGYETGKQYNLRVADYEDMGVRRLDNTGDVNYASISAFLRNWCDIHTI